MVISKTPLRMSFVGGGSDMPSFYRNFGGAVLSTSIDKYIYINVNKKFDNGIRIAYSKTEEVDSIEDIEHKIVKETLRYLNIKGGLEITTIADVPAKGTGLGSSSTFTVGLLNALNAFKNFYSSSENLGIDSCKIEIDICKEPIGKQDQYAAAYGGFNLIEFKKDDSVVVTPLIASQCTIKEIEENLILFYTGITRSASAILLEQNKEILKNDEKKTSLLKMVNLTYDLFNEIQNNNTNIFGEILHENWILKKSITGSISNKFIDDCYQTAIDAGAIGGKILGAGAGGFLLFYAPKKFHKKIENSLSNLKRIDFKFENLGSQIIYYK
jgi:D-glycero-alpha-D-manno-heptose-7-phosphate kinase